MKQFVRNDAWLKKAEICMNFTDGFSPLFRKYFQILEHV